MREEEEEELQEAVDEVSGVNREVETKEVGRNWDYGLRRSLER